MQAYRCRLVSQRRREYDTRKTLLAEWGRKVESASERAPRHIQSDSNWTTSKYTAELRCVPHLAGARAQQSELPLWNGMKHFEFQCVNISIYGCYCWCSHNKYFDACSRQTLKRFCRWWCEKCFIPKQFGADAGLHCSECNSCKVITYTHTHTRTHRYRVPKWRYIIALGLLIRSFARSVFFPFLSLTGWEGNPLDNFLFIDNFNNLIIKMEKKRDILCAWTSASFALTLTTYANESGQ